MKSITFSNTRSIVELKYSVALSKRVVVQKFTTQGHIQEFFFNWLIDDGVNSFFTLTVTSQSMSLLFKPLWTQSCIYTVCP